MSLWLELILHSLVHTWPPNWAAAKGDWLGIQRYKHICFTCWCWEVTRGHLHGRPGKKRHWDKFLSDSVNTAYLLRAIFLILSGDTAPWPSSFLQKYSRHFHTKRKVPKEVGLWYIQDQDLKALLIVLDQYRGTNTSDDVPVICWKEEDFLAKMLTPTSVWAQVFNAGTGEAVTGWGLGVAWSLRDSICKQHVCLLQFLISWLKKRLAKQRARYE